MENKTSIHKALMEGHASRVVANAHHLKKVLDALGKIGPQGTWLGSRTLGLTTHEYKWACEVARLLAVAGIAAKTGLGQGLMMAPHHGCQLAGRPDLVIGVGAGFIKGEGAHPYLEGGHIFSMPDFNTRHDALFFNSLFHIGLIGRLGTCHEKFDLLNRLKHGLLGSQPIYLVERNGYYSELVNFLTGQINRVVGPRVSLADFEMVKFIDLDKTKPEAFVEMLLADIGFTEVKPVDPSAAKKVVKLRADRKAPADKKASA
jgi:predicted Rossmann-fold nucleotide-binding protein